MNIQTLQLLAFGPFTDHTLDFSSGNGQLHIVYGANEAGKSSSLRALKALLYGVNPRTKDNFLHNNRSLRIGGTLLSHSGESLSIVRRKGNKDTLLSPEGEALDEAVMAPFLHGLSVEIFDTLFGIDYQSLIHGGEEILEQKGEVGQALFSASTGSANLHRVLLQLEKETEDLFKPNGSAPAVNAAIKSYADIQKAIREQSLSSRDWDEAQKSFEHASDQLTQTQNEVHELKKQRSKLLRIERSLPRIVERKHALTDVHSLGEVTVLAEDFDKRRQDAVNALDSALATADNARIREKGLHENVREISFNKELLEQQELLEELYSGLGARRKALKDRPRLQADRDSRLTRAELIIRAISPVMGLADAETLRPVLARSTQIAELANQRQALIDKSDQYSDLAAELEDKHKDALRQLEKLPPATGRLDSLAAQLKISQKAGDIDEQLRAVAEGVYGLTTDCEQGLAGLGKLWQGSLDTVATTGWPSSESIARFEKDFMNVANTANRYTEKYTELMESAREAKKQLDEIRHAGELPTETDLLDARGDRDDVWQLLTRKWIYSEDVSSESQRLGGDKPLDKIFESRIEQADDLSDRLRREAARVQKQAHFLATVSDAESHIAVLESKLSTCAAQTEQLTIDWKALWQPEITEPLAPTEMRLWVDRMNSLKALSSELSKLRQRGEGLAATREFHISSLSKELLELDERPASTVSLSRALAESELVFDRLAKNAAERAALVDSISDIEVSIAKATSDATDAAANVEVWKAHWTAAIQGMGLNENATPAQAMVVLENVRELFSELKESADLEARIEAIDTDEGAYTAEVKALANHVAPDLAELPADQAITHLMVSLADAGKQEATLRQLNEQLVAAQQDIAASELTATTMAQRIAALCKEAACDDHTELDVAVQRSRDYLDLRANLEKLEKELLEIGKGVALDEMELEAATADPDSLPGLIESLSYKIEHDKEPQITAYAQEKGVRQKELALMDGGNAAAVLAEEAQSILANVRSNSEKYVHLKLASRVLRDEIERYRREHQGPILKHASEHFAKLTLGSFVELRADFDEKDKPVLAGVRPDGTHVYVDGMSSGTRDQLYLALRLASLEKYIASVEPMPFIVDDILVHFDDRRSVATLEILAELAQQTQIILFTHHSHLVVQAQAMESENVCIHRL